MFLSTNFNLLLLFDGMYIEGTVFDCVNWPLIVLATSMKNEN